MNSRLMRVDADFMKKIKELKRKRAVNTNKDLTSAQITKKMLKMPSFKDLEKDILHDKRGAIFDIMIWIVIGIITILFLGAWQYSHQILTDTIVGIEGTGTANVSGVGQDTFGAVNTATTSLLKTIAFAIIFAMGLSILISNFLVRTHPVFFIIYILINIVAVIFSAYISNAYEIVLQGDLLGSTLSSWTATNFIIENLPIWTLVIGSIGAVLLFISMQKDSELGGGIV